jgi:hypothetical protein
MWTNLRPAVEDASLLQNVGHRDAPVELVLLGHVVSALGHSLAGEKEARAAVR